MLSENTVTQFLQDLASSKPAPGGGSAAALCGAIGAALVSMVGNLTTGKKKYADVEDQIQAMLGQAETLRLKFIDLVSDDIQVYTAVSAAFKMPRDTDELKATRQAAAIWVARSHKIEYLSPAFAGDEIEALTWVADFRKVRSLRRYQFVRTTDQTTLARGETDWVFMDANKGKPRSIPEEVRAPFDLLPDDQSPG